MFRAYPMVNSFVKVCLTASLLLALSGCNFGSVSFEETGPPSGGANTQTNAAKAKGVVLVAATDFEAGRCEPVEIYSIDANGKAAPVLKAEVVTLTSIGGNAVYFEDSDCLNSITSITIPKDRAKRTFFAKATIIGGAASVSVVATPASLGFNSRFMGIIRKARSIAYTVQPPNGDAGYCGTIATVTGLDGQGDPFNFTGSVPLTGLGNAQAFTDPACSGTAITSLSFSNESVKSFYLKDNTIQNLTVVATTPAGHPTMSGSASKAVQMRAAPFNVDIVNFPATGLELTNYSAAAIQVKLLDVMGNPFAPTSAYIVTLSASAGTIKFSADGTGAGTATLGLDFNSANTKTFFAKPESDGSVTAQAAASYSGRPLNDTGTGTVTIVPKSIILRNATVATGPLSLASGACSSRFNVTLKDGLDRDFTPTANVTVTLSPASTTTFKKYSDPTCSTEITSLTITPTTISPAFYVKETAEANSTKNMTATASGFTSNTYVVNVQANTVALTNATVTNGPLSLGSGACSSRFNVTIKDFQGNDVTPSGNVPVTLAPATTATFKRYSDSRCETELTSLTITPTTISPAFYIKETSETSSTKNMTATANGVTSNTYVVNVARSPFSVDPAFGTNGKNDFTISSGGTDVVNAAVEGPSGGYYMVGTSRTSSGNNRVGVAKLKANGDFDTSFNTTGKLASFGGCTIAEGYSALVSGSNLVVSGRCDSKFHLQVISSDGTISQTTSTTVGDGSTAGATGLASSGTKFYAVGKVPVTDLGPPPTTTDQFGIVRYNSDGTFDVSATVPLDSAIVGTLMKVRGVAYQSDSGVDKLIVLAAVDAPGGGTNLDMAFCRISDNAGFSLDTAFGDSGCKLFDGSGRDESPAFILPTSGGKFLGVSTSVSGSISAFFMAQVNANGSIDTSFGDAVNHVRSYTDGKLEAYGGAFFNGAGGGGEFLVVGAKKIGSPNPLWYAARFQSDGSNSSTPSPAKTSYTDENTSDSAAENIGAVVIPSDNRPVFFGTVGSSQRATQVLH